MRNVSHILEKQLTDYLVTDQARFYRLAYSYLKNWTPAAMRTLCLRTAR